MNSWGSPGDAPGEFHEPIGIAVAHDKVFVSDAGNNRIQVFDKTGGFLHRFGQGRQWRWRTGPTDAHLCS